MTVTEKPTRPSRKLARKTKRPTKVEVGAVEIARDVIRLMKAKKLVARTMTYLTLDSPIPTGTKELQTLIEQDDFKCYVCAIGGLFVSLVAKENACPIRWGPELGRQFGRVPTIPQFRQDGMRRRLRKYFSREQLGLIEAAFERSIRFGYKYDDPSDRMIAIMRNIIRNQGEFKP